MREQLGKELRAAHAAWDVGAVHGVHAMYCVSKLGTAWRSAVLRLVGDCRYPTLGGMSTPCMSSRAAVLDERTSRRPFRLPVREEDSGFKARLRKRSDRSVRREQL
jgi:hypothetical protein